MAQKSPQAGVTLIELLAVIALLGVISIPLFMALGDAYQRTVQQERETHLLLYAESIMEAVKVAPHLSADVTVDGIYFDKGECRAGNCETTVSPGDDVPTYTVKVEPYEEWLYPDELLLVEVEVHPSSTDRREQSVRLVTVVRP